MRHAVAPAPRAVLVHPIALAGYFVALARAGRACDHPSGARREAGQGVANSLIDNSRARGVFYQALLIAALAALLSPRKAAPERIKLAS